MTRPDYRIAHHVDRLTAALKKIRLTAQQIKGGDSPLWTHADMTELPDDHAQIEDPATYTAVYAADCLDEVEEMARVALEEK